MNIEFKICATLDEFNTLRDAGEIQDSWVVLIEDQPALWTNGKLLPSPYTKEQLESLFVTIASKGIANGIATLNENGKIPESQLPSYVDDVLEFDNLAAFPTVGESGKIYVAIDTNLTYRWSGSTYVEISPSIALGETESTAYAGDKGKALADKLGKIYYANLQLEDPTVSADAIAIRSHDYHLSSGSEHYSSIYLRPATQDKAGIMTAADKVWADYSKNFVIDSFNYVTLVNFNERPKFNGAIGRFEITSYVHNGEGHLIKSDTPVYLLIPQASSSEYGLMPYNLFNKLADLNPRLVTLIPGIDRTATDLGIVTVSTIYRDGDYTDETSTSTRIPAANPLTAGVMTAADKIKLDSLSVQDKIHFETYAEFKKALNAGNIPENAVVYIEDTEQIYTQGQYYGKIPTHGIGTGAGSEIFNSSSNIASSNLAHAEGQSTSATGTASHAEGSNTSASGESSHAEGGYSYAVGTYSHAEGGSTANKLYSHAEGYVSVADGDYSHAEGFKTTAGGENSHSEGRETKAEGPTSHSEGYRAFAKGPYSHVEGFETIANNNSEHAQGIYNKSTPDNTNGFGTRFSHGIGDSSTDRKNAIEIMSNGDIYFGTYGIDPKAFDAATKKLTRDILPDNSAPIIISDSIFNYDETTPSWQILGALNEHEIDTFDKMLYTFRPVFAASNTLLDGIAVLDVSYVSKTTNIEINTNRSTISLTMFRPDGISSINITKESDTGILRAAFAHSKTFAFTT